MAPLTPLGGLSPEDQHLLDDEELELFLESRRAHFESFIWQVPGISIAAQAFLFTVIFDVDREPFVRAAIAAVGLVVSLATIQLMLKHRHAEEVYAEAIDLARRVRGQRPLEGLTVLEDLTARFGSERHRKRRQRSIRRFFVTTGAVDVWLVTLASFGVFEGLVFVYNAVALACQALS